MLYQANQVDSNDECFGQQTFRYDTAGDLSVAKFNPSKNYPLV